MKARWAGRRLVLMALFALPLVLLFSSIRIYREMEEQRAVYLRTRAADVAARLETAGDIDVIAANEPGLADLKVIARGDNTRENSRLEPLWEGSELFRTGFLKSRGRELYRAYVPFHSGEGLRIARIDLAVSSADFLLVHARHNVLVSIAGGLVLMLLALYAVWSDRRAAEMERQQLRMEHLAHIGKMTAVLAHEIRNPLGTIKGFAQLALERADAKTSGLLEPVLTETGRLENLVNDLLLYGRPPVPSIRTVEWLALTSALGAQAGSVRFVCDSRPWRFQSDPDLLRQVLLNLVRNAVEAVRELPGGEVRLSIAEDGAGGARIAVADNGPGIPEADRDKVFEPFFTTKAFGTGLGLAICQNLVKSLQGRLELLAVEPQGLEAAIVIPSAGLEQ